MQHYTPKRVTLFFLLAFTLLMAFFLIPTYSLSGQGMSPEDAGIIGLFMLMLASGSLLNRLHALVFPLQPALIAVNPDLTKDDTLAAS